MSGAPPFHLVQVGWDHALLDTDAASDSLQRQARYLALLKEHDPASRSSIIVLGAPSAAGERVSAGIRIIPLSGRWRSQFALNSELYRLHRESSISVIAAQSPHEEGWACLSAGAKLTIPVVGQLHFDLFSAASLPGGSAARRMAGRTRQWNTLRLLPRYTALRTVSAHLSEAAIRAGAREVRCIPVPITDLPKFNVLTPSQSSRRLLFVGRLAPEKNLPLLLDVLARVRERFADAEADLVGDGPLREALEHDARQRGLAGAVHFHGAVSREKLPAVFARAEAFLLPSQHEGFGRVLVEAMAAGLPVVSTRTSGAVAVLENGLWGDLADIGDADGLAQAVMRIFSDPASAHARAGAARGHVFARYAPDTLARQWMDMLIDASAGSRT
jgi:glycosyltransferase involved in cell wall biosynthesis